MCNVTDHNTDNRIETEPASSLSSSLKSFLKFAPANNDIMKCLMLQEKLNISALCEYLLSGAKNLI